MQSTLTFDELASLFSNNLTFQTAGVRIASDNLAAAPPPAPTPPPVYSASQHYTHSSHVFDDPHSSNSCERILRIHGINPLSLTPSQINLFRVADPAQKMRLLELWSICPPSAAADIPSLAWSSTSVEQEEQLARMRFDRRAQSEPRHQVMSLDGTTVQANNGTWQHNEEEYHPHADSEPYMMSGYEELMRREQDRQQQQQKQQHASDRVQGGQYSHFGSAIGGAAAAAPVYSPATDPVYLGTDYARQQLQQQQNQHEQHQMQMHMDMAAKYGAFEHLRAGNEPEAMMI